jgi:hypothetical protein
MLSLSARAPESTGIHASTKVPRAIRFDEKTPIPGRDRGLQEKARRFVGTLNLDVAPRMVRIASGQRSSGRRRSLGEVGGLDRGTGGSRRSSASRPGPSCPSGRVGRRPARRRRRSRRPIVGRAASFGRPRDQRHVEIDRSSSGTVSPRRDQTGDLGVRVGPRRHDSWTGRHGEPAARRRGCRTSSPDGRAAPVASGASFDRAGPRWLAVVRERGCVAAPHRAVRSVVRSTVRSSVCRRRSSRDSGRRRRPMKRMLRSPGPVRREG